MIFDFYRQTALSVVLARDSLSKLAVALVDSCSVALKELCKSVNEVGYLLLEEVCESALLVSA